MNLNTIFLGIIAAVAVGAAVVWWSSQPSASERWSADWDRRMDKIDASIDRMRKIDAQLEAIGSN